MDLSLRSDSYTNDDQSWLGSAHGTSSARTVTLQTSLFTANTHYPNGYFPSGIPLGKVTATGLYGPYAGSPTEVQTVTITGAPTGGTFTLTYDGATTAGIAFNATAAAVRSALEALTTVNQGDITVTGSAGGPYTVTFGGPAIVGGDVPQMTASGASLTGGSSPAAGVATATGGGATATDGTQIFVGHLFTAVKAPASTSTNVFGALFVHGIVREAKLPLPVDGAAKAAAQGRILYV
jgi:hypothetical protein